MLFRVIVVLLLTEVCFSLQYGRKSRRNRPRIPQKTTCNELDPEPIEAFDLNELTGKQWFGIRAKPDDEFVNRQNGIALSDFRFEYFKRRPGEVHNDLIISNRPVVNPNVCTVFKTEFIPIKGREGFDWKFLCEIWGFPLLAGPWRLLYKDDNFFINWECLKRDRRGSCLSAISVVFSSSPSTYIPTHTFTKMEAAVRQKACFDLKRDYLTTPFLGKKRCPNLKPNLTEKYGK